MTVVLTLLLLSGLPAFDAGACPSCFGDPDSPMSDGMDAAILILLTITGSVLAGVSIFFLYLRKRWVRLNRQFQHMMN